jgi:hypothetical protein
MNVIEEITQKIDEYFAEQPNNIQDKFDDIDSIKDEIDFKVYLGKKLIDLNIEALEEEISFNYISKEGYELSIDTNIKLSYKNNPFLIINTNDFKLERFDDEENRYYASFLLALNQNWDNLNKDNQFWFFIPSCTIDESNLESFIQFILLINGKFFHNPIETQKNQFLSNDIKDVLDCNIKSFNQYQESSYILSEYNHTKDILLKYLLLYHIIENFMYRRPIAEMANTSFSIRDFKRLYKNIDTNEVDTLSKLFKEISTNAFINNITLEEYINNLIEELKNQGFINIASFINILGFDFANLKYLAGQKKSHEDFRKFIYQIRNSIVHNKETEFHITHNTFQSFPDLNQLFEKLLLPALENIIYFLIFKENSIIDYPKNHLLLYGEDGIS